MSMSGVKIDDAVIKAYTDMKDKHIYQFCVFKIENGKVVVDEDNCKTKAQAAEMPGDPYDHFCGQLPPQDCRYALFDMPYTTKNGVQNEKLVFFLWNPDNAPVKSKMVYASTKMAIKDKFKGISLDKECSDPSDLKKSEVQEALL